MRRKARNAQGSLLGKRPSAEFCMISFDLQPQPLVDGIRYTNELLITSKIRNLHDWRDILLSYDRDLIWIRDGWWPDRPLEVRGRFFAVFGVVWRPTPSRWLICAVPDRVWKHWLGLVVHSQIGDETSSEKQDTD